MKKFLDPERILSPFKFAWLSKVFLLDQTNDAIKLDIFKLQEKQSSTYIYNRIQESWNKIALQKKEKLGKSISLIRVIMDLFGVDILFTGFMQLIYELFTRALLPLLLVKLLRYFKDDSKMEQSEACYWASGIILCVLIRTHFWHYVSRKMILLGVKIRMACSSLVYKKILSLSGTSLEKKTTIGKVINLLTNDATSVEFTFHFLHYVWTAPLQAILTVYIIYDQIGFIAMCGASIFFIFIPIQGILGKMVSRLHSKIDVKTDDRLRLINEVITCIQVIKMFTWEKSFINLINETRKNESNELYKMNIVTLTSISSVFYISRLALFINFVGNAIFNKSMTTESFFLFIVYCIDVQNIINYFFPLAIQLTTRGFSSIKRIEEFLVLDEIEVTVIPSTIIQKENHIPIGTVILQNVSTKWDLEIKQETLKDISLFAKSGSFTAIVGQVASGKSSLLKTILQELPLLQGTISVFGKIAYVSQNPWIYSSSIRQNIIFNKPMDQDRYDRVVRVCQLEQDFSFLRHKDQTIIGEKGINLSGGQKARVALARAVYSDADIYVLDDLFSAVDTKVGRLIWSQCLCNFLKNKTRILVTHHLQYLQDVDFIYVLSNGEVRMEGTYLQLKDSLKNYNTKSFDNQFSNSSFIDNKPLILGNEQIEESESKINRKFSRNIYLALLDSVGNWWLITSCILLIFTCQISLSASDFFAIQWVSRHAACSTNFYKENITNSDEVKSSKICSNTRGGLPFIYIYGVLIGVTIITTYIKALVFSKIYKNASTSLHSSMLHSVIQGNMSFFYKNTSGIILSRFSKDMGTVDKYLPKTIHDLILVCSMMMAVIIFTANAHYLLVLPMIVTGFILYLLTKMYFTTSRNLKQFIHISQSSVLKILNDTLCGLTTIRSFKAEEFLTKEFHQNQDLYASIYRVNLNTSRGFRYFIDIVFSIYLTVICFNFILMGKSTPINDVSLILFQSISIVSVITWGLFQATELDYQMTAVERILEFCNIEQEASIEIIPEKDLDEKWPSDGAVEFRNVFLKYCPRGNPVLKNVSFIVAPRAKIGIVGRTGSGKSSLVAALFRLGFLDGEIFIDKVQTTKLQLWKLRSKISIIPQQPLLFFGSLRKNLDPFDEFSDYDLCQALHAVKLTNFIFAAGGLEAVVADGGINFSVGQRQLFCLARAFVKKSKILVLDEATANLDFKTDALIHKTINTRFKNCTVFTIAHRLDTIMGCDKVIVLAHGRLVEFDHPQELLKNKNGLFYEMVQNFSSDSSEIS